MGGSLRFFGYPEGIVSKYRPFEYSHDAIIAEAAVHYGCTLVSDDKELRDLVNATLSGRAITTDELLEKISIY